MLLYKRLERSRFPYRFSAQPSRQLITEQQLKGLLIGLDWQMISNWEEIEFDNYF
jgi:hypothetical protein